MMFVEQPWLCQMQMYAITYNLWYLVSNYLMSDKKKEFYDKCKYIWFTLFRQNKDKYIWFRKRSQKITKFWVDKKSLEQCPDV